MNKRDRAAVSRQRGLRQTARALAEKGANTLSAAFPKRVAGLNFTVIELACPGLSHAIRTSRVLPTATARLILRRVLTARTAGRNALDSTNTLVNAILASDFSRNIESWLGQTFNEGTPSIYDKAVDVIYNTTRIGGGYLHRLFDESHTPWRMWERVTDALPNDTRLEEVIGYVTALGKDLSSTVGIPLVDWPKTSFEQTASALDSEFGIPRSWLADCVHVNVNELFGSAIATISLCLGWKEKQTGEFSRIAGSLGLSSLISANPALGIVALAAVAKAFVEARQTGDYASAVEGLAKGGVGTGILLLTASSIPGPAWIGILAGVCMAVAAQRAAGAAEVAQVAVFFESSLRRVLPSRIRAGLGVLSP